MKQILYKVRKKLSERKFLSDFRSPVESSSADTLQTQNSDLVNLMSQYGKKEKSQRKFSEKLN